MIRCAECNEENMDGLEYCDGCGAKLEAVAADGAGAADVAPAETPAAQEASTQGEEAAETAGAETAGAETASADASADAQETTPEATAEEAVDVPVDAPAESEPQEVAQEVAQEMPVDAPASEGQSAGTAAALTLTRGGTVGKVFELQAGDNLVGRWDPDSGSFPEVDMENDDPEARISRKHALIKFAETLTIEDIGSLNGTFVNRGPRLEPGSPATLKDGDEIIIGKTFFKVSVTT